ncbi:MAG: hypothetical protein ACRD1N_00020 [Terriglobia bacterium]
MKTLKWLLGIVLVAVAASVLLRAFAGTHKDPPDQDDEDQEEAVQAPSRVSVVNGQTVVTLDEATQRHIAIAVETLRATEARQQTVAAGVVLAVQDLISLHNAYVMARADVQRDQASLRVSQKEYQRLAGLYKQNENTSEKSLEAAEGLFIADQATLNAARQQMQGAESAVQSSWGAQVAGWVANDSKTLGQVLNQRELPVQVTLPPGSSFTDPPSIELTAPDGSMMDAAYVSPFPRMDPRIQGIGLLYLTPARPGLAPGTTLVVHFSTGRRRKGVLLPHSAIVWWQGQAWVYEQTAPTQFTRRLVPTDEPLRRGYFAAQGFRAGSMVVVRGAQELLSEEFRSQIQPED